MTDPLVSLLQRWREQHEEALTLVRQFSVGGDYAGNRHAFAKEARIWKTCADELEAVLASQAPPSAQETPDLSSEALARIYRDLTSVELMREATEEVIAAFLDLKGQHELAEAVRDKSYGQAVDGASPEQMESALAPTPAPLAQPKGTD